MAGAYTIGKGEENAKVVAQSDTDPTIIGHEVPLVCVAPAGGRPGLTRKFLKAKGLEVGNPAWLGGRDSNPDSAVQSRMSYH